MPRKSVSTLNGRAPQKIVETIKLYLATNKIIILVYPIPEAGWNVPIKQAKDAMFSDKQNFSADYLSTSFDVYKSRNAETIKVLDSIGEHPNLIRVKPERILCNSYALNRCITQLHELPLYYDDDHLNNQGANLITNDIIKHIK